MINNFNFHGNLNINFGCKPCNTQPTAETNCGAYVKGMTLDFENNLLIFNIEGTIGTNVNVTLSVTDGNTINTDCSLVADTYSISIDTFGNIVGTNGTIALNAYSDECTTLLCSESYSYITNPVEVPLEGNAVIYNPTIDTCNDTIAYVELLNGIGNGVSMNTSNGIVTVDAQAIESNMPIYIYYATCNGIISNLIFLFLGNPQGPQQMYSCSGNTCVEDVNGQYDHPSCYGNCNGGGGQMYSCVEGNCVPDNNGQYNNNSCNGNCNGGGQQTMYSCSGGTCVEDANGIYNDSNCYGTCIATYSCDGNTCIEDINGTYYTTNCDYACEEPVLLGFIELDDIANTPVPGNSAHDWSNYVGNYQAFTSTVIIGNKIEFYGIPMLNIHLAFSNITLVDYDFSGFTYLYSLIMDTVNGLSTFNLIHTNLQAIYLYNVDIITLDLSGCINLNILTVSNALMITSININNNTLLNGLQLYNIPLVTGIDFTNNLALTSLSIEKHGLTSIDITLNTALNYLRVYNNNNYTINSIDLSNNINLNVINIVGTNIVSLDISNILDLTQIDIHNNLLLSSIDITNAPNLTVFDGSNTAITSIDTSNNSLLYYLNLYNTPIVGIDTSLNTVLGILNLNSCSNLTTYVFSSSINTLIFNNLPQFTTVDISGCVNLRTFDGSGTPLSNINITNNPLLNNIRLFFCAISDVNNINALLAYLVSINYTGYLDISGGTNAAPTGQGILDVATLIGNGASVTTN